VRDNHPAGSVQLDRPNYLWHSQAGPRSLRLQPEPTDSGAWTHIASQTC
jgi:hypothetical protein